jgi:guanylate kinase
MSKNGMMVILSAPSGAGKDTVFKEISRTRSDVCESISATTREPRAGETDGVNYYFLTQSEFEKKIENNEFLEYASYNNCYYGTPASTVLKLVEEGKICFLIIERKGAQKIMKSYPEAVSIFLMPPDMETLEKRLKKRNTDSEEAIISRLKIAEEEIKSASEFDYIVINNELEKAVDEINEILSTELRKRNA